MDGGVFQRSIRWALFLIVVLPTSNAWAAPKCNSNGNPLTVSATNIAFGSYDAASGSNLTANGTITMTCVDASRDIPALSVALSVNGTPRTMSFSSNTLNYNIYTSSAYTTIWGDGTGSTVVQTSPGVAANTISMTAYGQIPAGQYVTPGSYSSTITVTVTY